MRKVLLATTAATLAIFAGAVSVSAAAPQTHLLVAAANSAADVDVQKLIGRHVADQRNATIGKVESVLVDNDGKAKFVIVDVGGWLGIGSREVAVRWDQLTFADNNEKIILNATKEQLAALPAHRYPNAAGQGQVYAYSDDVKANPYLADSAADGKTAATIDLHKLIGRNITNGSHTVGDINSVMTDKDGNVRYVVVGVGGFLGIGEKEVALPWKDLAISENGEKVTANVTKEQLKAMPEHRFADTARRGTVYSYDEDLKANPYLADGDTAASSDAPPLSGANSFTETQARSRIEEGGFADVSGLKKDDHGIWRGTAMKDGKSVNVALDFKGNVVVAQ